MADNKKTVGIYYGVNSIYLVLSTSTKANKLFAVSNKSSKSSKTGASDFLTEGGADQQEVTQQLQQSLLKYNAGKDAVSLSLPTKDIIFRSFVIPWMQSHEIKGVVDFEAGKYIPFPLSELSYSYHPSTVNVAGSKRIRITFVAIKKSELEKYTNLLHHANIKIDSIEPAATSLIRTLIHKKILLPNQTAAIVSKKGTSGKIIIVDESIPQFVREFQLKLPQDKTAGEINRNELKDRLYNEIRISLEYFNRQNNQAQAKEIIFISEDDCTDIAQKLQENLNLPTKPFLIQSILNHPDCTEMEYLNSYGASLIKAVNIPANFDLSSKSKQSSKFQPGGFSHHAVDYKKPILVGIGCVCAIAAVIFLTSSLSKIPKQNLQKLKEDLASVDYLSTPKLELETQRFSEKLNIFENSLYESKVSEFLDLIPDLLPDGIWINTLNIDYVDPIFDTNRRRGQTRSRTSAISITDQEKPSLGIIIDGYAYLKNTNKQFQLVDTFVEKLQENEKFSKSFTSISSGDKSRETIEEHVVTTFTITCE